EAKPTTLKTIRLTWEEGGVGFSRTAEIARAGAGMVAGSHGPVSVTAATRCGAAGRCPATFPQPASSWRASGPEGTALPAVGAPATALGAAAGLPARCRRLSKPPRALRTGASGSVAVRSANGLGAVESSVLDAAPTSPGAGDPLRDFFDQSLVAITVPGRTC